MPFISTTEMNALTHRKLRRTIIDQRYKSQTLLAILRARERIQIEDGGALICQPILVDFNETGQSYAGADVWNVDPNEEISEYELKWKNLKTTVTITGDDRLSNTGREQSINFLTAKQDTALMKLMDLISGQLFGDGSGNDTKDIDGLAAAVNSATGYQQYLNLDRLANPWWAAQAFQPAVATALSAGNMAQVFSAARTDIEVPSVHITTKATYNLYEALVTPGERLVDDFVGNLGFDNIAYKGKPLVEDSHCPAGTLYMLNLTLCRLVVHKDRNFTFRDFSEPVDQDAQIGHWLVRCNLEVQKPAANGVMTNILNG